MEESTSCFNPAAPSQTPAAAATIASQQTGKKGLLYFVGFP